ncbi:hypothetical protein QOT17_013574 [Balamuthia mandrillaris]
MKKGEGMLLGARALALLSATLALFLVVVVQPVLALETVQDDFVRFDEAHAPQKRDDDEEVEEDEDLPLKSQEFVLGPFEVAAAHTLYMHQTEGKHRPPTENSQEDSHEGSADNLGIKSVRASLLFENGTAVPSSAVQLRYFGLMTTVEGRTDDICPEREGLVVACTYSPCSIQFPEGYAYALPPEEEWDVHIALQNKDEHNTYKVTLKYTVRYLPAAQTNQLKALTPVLLDVCGCSSGADECTINQETNVHSFTAPFSGELIYSKGRLSEGGLYTSLTLKKDSSKDRVLLCNSTAVSSDSGSTTASPAVPKLHSCEPRVKVVKGDNLELVVAFAKEVIATETTAIASMVTYWDTGSSNAQKTESTPLVVILAVVFIGAIIVGCTACFYWRHRVQEKQRKARYDRAVESSRMTNFFVVDEEEEGSDNQEEEDLKE